MVNRIVRFTFAILCAVLGHFAAVWAQYPLEILLARVIAIWTLEVAGVVLGGAIGFLAAPWVTRQVVQLAQWLEGRLQRISVLDLFLGAVGLIFGLIIANLIGSAFKNVSHLNIVLPIAGSLLLGYLGMSVAMKKREELSGVFSNLRSAKPMDKQTKGTTAGLSPKILDTSVIIDGRIADIHRSGFLEGTLIIPSFVLEELRHIADSADTLKRNRGRRGLDILNTIQKQGGTTVQIYEEEVGEGLEVDIKLVKLAQKLEGIIVTNDFNLNKVAQLHGVRVLNINELANAVKPVVLPGEDILVHIVKDGKESGQGVAYLDDGTMIVVDSGKRFIGDTIGVTVTSVLQTSAGRMIFAKPKFEERVAHN
ncbi:MAG: PIN/TRAM domain-containing protein [Bacillota bacterium]